MNKDRRIRIKRIVNRLDKLVIDIWNKKENIYDTIPDDIKNSQDKLESLTDDLISVSVTLEEVIEN